MLFALIALLTIGPFLLVCLIAYGLYRKASRADHLEGQLIQSEKRADQWKEHAEKALGLAFERHFPADTVIEWQGHPRPSETAEDYSVEVKHYVPQIAANCRKCGVSVRKPPESFPTPCPACKSLIDPILDDTQLEE